MKFFIALFLSLIADRVSAQESCNYLMMSTQVVSALLTDVKNVQSKTLDPNFCQAIQDCQDYMGYIRKTVALKNKSQFEYLPKSIAETKKKIAEADAQKANLLKGSKQDAIKAVAYDLWLKTLQYHLEKTEQSYLTYQKYTQDPETNLDHYESGSEFAKVPTFEDSETLLRLIQENFENLPSQIKEEESNFEQLKKQAMNDNAKNLASGIEWFEKSIGVMKENHKKYQSFLKDPKNSPFPHSSPVKPSSKKVTSSSCDYVGMLFDGARSRAAENKSGLCGLTPEQVVATSYYTDEGYGCMNTYLRNRTKPFRNLDLLIKALDGGLDKLPNYKGLVRRGGDLPDAVRKQHTPGAIVNYAAYTSSSTSVGFDHSKDLFMIYSKSGKPIMGFSGHEDEYEVLFKGGTKFKVLDVKKTDEKNYYILKEVSDVGNKQEEAVADAKLLQSMKALSAGKSETSENADSWVCPLDDSKAPPKAIVQKIAPKF